MQILKSYIDEFLEYVELWSFEINWGIQSLFFWRGQVRVGKLNLPLHSLLAFVSATYVIERPHLIPAWIFFCAAWCMLILMSRRSNHPSPWYRSRSFFFYLRCFLPFLPAADSRGVHIDAGEGVKEQREMEEKRKKTMEEDKMLQSKIATVRRELQQMLAAVNQVNLVTSERNGLHPLSRLLPVQLILRGMCSESTRIPSL